MEIIQVETKKRIHEFSYAQKVSNQISPDKSHIKLNESLFNAQILEKQSCTLIRNIQKDLLMKIKKYDSILKKSNIQKIISISQPTSPPTRKNQLENQQDTQLQKEIKPNSEKIQTEITLKTTPNELRRGSLPIKKLDVKLSNFSEEKPLFSSQDISPIKQEQNKNKLSLRRNTTQNTATPKQKKSSVADILGSYAKLHVSKSTSTQKPNLIESKNQIKSTKETKEIKEIKQKDIKNIQSVSKKQSGTTDYTFRQKQNEVPIDKQSRIKKNQKQKLSIDLCVNSDLKEIIHIINDLDLFNNRLKKKS